MKEAKSEAEKIIASYKADMEATYQVSLAKVNRIIPQRSPHHSGNYNIPILLSSAEQQQQRCCGQRAGDFHQDGHQRHGVSDTLVFSELVCCRL